MGWKSLLKSVAPVIGTTLGGPVGATAARFLAEKALGKEKSDSITDDAIDAALDGFFGASPTLEQIALAKDADREFSLKAKELGVELHRISADDRKDARKANAGNNLVHWVGCLLTFMVVVFIFSFAFYLTSNPDLELNAYLTALIQTPVTGVVGYWAYLWGTSNSSKEKTAVLGEALRGKNAR